MSVLVFGASSGYGLSIVRNSLEAGKKVIACSRKAKSAKTLYQLTAKYREQIHISNVDVTKVKEIKRLYQQVNGLCIKIDEIYFTVGHAQDTKNVYPLTASSRNNYFSLLKVNSFSAFEVLRQGIQILKDPFCGIYVYLSSTAAISSNCGHGPYNTSKLLLNGLMVNYASELYNKGINVKVVGLDPWEACTQMNRDSNISPEHLLPILEAIVMCKDWLRSGHIYTPDGNEVVFPGVELCGRNLFDLYENLYSRSLIYNRADYII